MWPLIGLLVCVHSWKAGGSWRQGFPKFWHPSRMDQMDTKLVAAPLSILCLDQLLEHDFHLLTVLDGPSTVKHQLCFGDVTCYICFSRMHAHLAALSHCRSHSSHKKMKRVTWVTCHAQVCCPSSCRPGPDLPASSQFSWWSPFW